MRRESLSRHQLVSLLDSSGQGHKTRSEKRTVHVLAILSIFPGADLCAYSFWLAKGSLPFIGPIVLSTLVYNPISLQTLTINELLTSVHKHIKNEQVANYLWIPIICTYVNIQVLGDWSGLKAPVICQGVCRLHGPGAHLWFTIFC